jgi:hypothetical protein
MPRSLLHWSIPLLLSCNASIALAQNAGVTCTITVAIVPVNATADHKAPQPGNQAKFSIVSSVKGMCPMMPDRIGTWTISDTANATISSQSPTDAVATCLNATGSPITVTNSGTVRGRSFPPATLICK